MATLYCILRRLSLPFSRPLSMIPCNSGKRCLWIFDVTPQTFA